MSASKLTTAAAAATSTTSHERSGSGGVGSGSAIPTQQSTTNAAPSTSQQTTNPSNQSTINQPQGQLLQAATPVVPTITWARTNILDRPLARAKNAEVSESAFLYLFSETVQYCQSRCTALADLQQRLSDVGHGVGVRFLELLTFRSGRLQRYTDLVEILRFISTTVWKNLFGREADALEKATGSEDTYWILDENLLVNKFINKDAGASCASFVAGIVQGILDSAEFKVKVSTIRYAGKNSEPNVYIKIASLKS